MKHQSTVKSKPENQGKTKETVVKNDVTREVKQKSGRQSS
jgi:hypothetical protein